MSDLIERAPREDEDPDEALGALIWDRIWGTTWSIASEDNRDAYRNLARAVREHIEAQQEDAVAFFRAEVDEQTARAEKAESDLARVTKERDRLTHLLGSHADGHRCTCAEIDPGKPGIEPPTWEQDPWCLTHPDMAVIVAEVKALKAKADHE